MRLALLTLVCLLSLASVAVGQSAIAITAPGASPALSVVVGLTHTFTLTNAVCLKVEWRLNGSKFATSSTPPYPATYRPQAAPRTHTLKATCFGQDDEPLSLVQTKFDVVEKPVDPPPPPPVVEPPPPPPVDPPTSTDAWRFSATPTTVVAGEPIALQFATPLDVHRIRINGLLPTYTCSTSCVGSLTVQPTISTTYVLTSSTAEGMAHPPLSISVTVMPAPLPPPLPPTTPPPPGPTPTEAELLKLPRLSKAQLVYEGAFLPPAEGYRYGAYGLGWSVLRQSLFASGEGSKILAGEFGVPDVRIAASPDALATAPARQALADPTDGRYGLAYPGGLATDFGRWGGFLPVGNKLISKVFHYYDSSGRQIASDFVSSLDLSVPNDTIGPFKIGGRTLEGFITEAEVAASEAAGQTITTTGFTSGVMGAIPSEWQAALGGKVAAGAALSSIIWRQCFGPCAFVFDPDQLTADVVPKPLVYYTQKYPTLGLWGGETPGDAGARQPASPYFNGTTDINGIVFPEGTRTMMFLGRHGIGPFCYGSTCLPDECQMVKCGQWNHAPPYYSYYWLYDAADFLRVKRGEIKPWEVKPYEVGILDLPFATAMGFLTGAAWDPATRRIFVGQEQNERQIIHVYRVP
jgi:hypothetical protein